MNSQIEEPIGVTILPLIFNCSFQAWGILVAAVKEDKSSFPPFAAARAAEAKILSKGAAFL